MNNVHQKPLHEGQIALARAYFVDKKKIVQSQWGRSSGKTETILFIAWARALLYPNSSIYIICPEKEQGKDIFWKSRRLQNYGPEEYISAARDSELTLVFKNGSYIVVSGAKNYDSLRGVKPDLVFYDEFQNHSEEFDKEVMRPNLLGRGSALIVTGTPPKRECYYTEFKKRLMNQIKEGDETRAYFQFPNTINPGLNQQEIEKEINALLAQGDEAIVRREYYGEDCYGGKDSVFPLWAPVRHVKPHGNLVLSCFEKASQIKWVCVCDPANHSCFAVLFCAHNPLTSQFFILDEIYQTDRKKTDVHSMWEQIQEKINNLNNLCKWHYIYDEREAWFAREMSANFGVAMTPTRKQRRGNSEDQGIHIIKILMRADNAFFVSDKCYWLRWEIENCVTDEEGELIDKNNHLLDCARYGLNYCGFSIREKVERSGTTAVRLGGEVIKLPKRSTNESWADDVVENSLNLPQWMDYWD